MAEEEKHEDITVEIEGEETPRKAPALGAAAADRAVGGGAVFLWAARRDLPQK